MFKNLQYLTLTNNNISELPSNFGDLSKLLSAFLGNNQLVTLPDSFGDLPSLQTLYLNANKFSTLPESFINIARARVLVLNLKDNALTVLPEKIGDLKRLATLDLANNQLSVLPDSIGDLPDLQTLNLENNQLTSLPDSLNNLPTLLHLSLQDNQLTSLPKSFENLKRLYYLRLHNNQLSQVPDYFVNFERLNLLRLENNQLTALPSNFGEFPNLVTLRLQNNQLTSLPNSFVNLANLEALSLAGNLLKTNESLAINGQVFTIDKQHQLQWNTGKPEKEINRFSDLLALDELIPLLVVEAEDTQMPLFPTHEFLFVGYYDEEGNEVDVNDYFDGDKVIKAGSLTFKVRATGEGIFPNNSDSAITLGEYTYILKVTDEGNETGVDPEEGENPGGETDGNGGDEENVSDVASSVGSKGNGLQLPQTGGANTQALQTSGVMGMLLSLLLLAIKGRKRRSTLKNE